MILSSTKWSPSQIGHNFFSNRKIDFEAFIACTNSQRIHKFSELHCYGSSQTSTLSFPSFPPLYPHRASPKNIIQCGIYVHCVHGMLLFVALARVVAVVVLMDSHQGWNFFRELWHLFKDFASFVISSAYFVQCRSKEVTLRKKRREKEEINGSRINQNLDTDCRICNKELPLTLSVI